MKQFNALKYRNKPYAALIVYPAIRRSPIQYARSLSGNCRQKTEMKQIYMAINKRFTSVYKLTKHLNNMF